MSLFSKVSRLPSGRCFLLLLVPLWAVGCGDGANNRASSSSRPSISATAPGSGAGARLKKLTGARTRAVWVRDESGGGDIFAVGEKLRLMGLDTGNPRGVRPLAEGLRNYSRPLLAPDGATVIYTDRPPVGKGGVTVWTVDWETGARRELRDGCAVDVWRDPASGAVWVYALKELTAVLAANPMGGPLIRFPLNDPAREEPVFSHRSINTDNVQVNGSATRASGLLPWPQAGTLDFATGRFLRNRNGCWASMAPDASNLSWVFDGPHQNVRMFFPGYAEPWRVRLSDAEGIGGKSVYHPRWSNHPRVIAFSGPHGSKLDEGGAGIDIVVARLDAACLRLEDSVNLRNETPHSDYYPDVWVEGGETVSLNVAGLGPKKLREAAPEKTPEAWAVAPEGLVFVWRSAEGGEDMRVGDPPRASRVTPARAGRFTARSGMLLDGGFFTADPASSVESLAAADSGVWCVEACLTPLARPEEERVILSLGKNLELRQHQETLYLLRGDRKWRMDSSLPEGMTTHVVLSSTGFDEPPRLFLDGTEVQVKNVRPRAEPAPPEGGLVFGALPDGTLNWYGALEGVALHAAPVRVETARGSARWWGAELAKRDEIPRSRVRAVLEAASARSGPADIEPYSRSWTAGRYRRLEVLEGADPGETFTVAHWTVLDKKPVAGPPGETGAEIVLELEPFHAHPEMESEDGSADVCDGGLPDFLDCRRLGES